MTNEEILQKLEEEILLRRFSPHTLEEYMLRAKTFMLYANRQLEELTEQGIRAYLLNLLDVKKLTEASVNGYNSALRFLFGAIVQVAMFLKLLIYEPAKSSISICLILLVSSTMIPVYMLSCVFSSVSNLARAPIGNIP